MPRALKAARSGGAQAESPKYWVRTPHAALSLTQLHFAMGMDVQAFDRL